MTSDPLIIHILSALTALGALVFVVLFMREPWWRTWFGRSLMMMATSILVFAVLVALTLWFGRDYWGREPLRIVGYSLIFVSMWSRVYVLWQVRRRDRADLPES